MRRQFPIVFVIAAVTVFVALSAAKDTQSRYEGRASLLFVSSPQTVDGQGKPITVNPFSLAGVGEQMASSAVLALSRSPGFHDQLRLNGARGDVKFRRTADAILEVKSSAKTPVAALETLDAAVKLASDQLSASQTSAGAPLGSYMKVETIASTDRAREIVGSPMKSVGAIAVVGIVAAVAAAVALDSVAPHGIRSAVRGVTRGIRRLGGLLRLPQPGRGASAPRPGGSASPSIPPTSSATPTPTPTPSATPTPTPTTRPSSPTPVTEPVSAPSSSSTSSPAGAPASQSVSSERGVSGAPASVPGPVTANRQMRRQAARTSNRSRSREPVARPSNGPEDASRASRSA